MTCLEKGGWSRSESPEMNTGCRGTQCLLGISLAKGREEAGQACPGKFQLEMLDGSTPWGAEKGRDEGHTQIRSVNSTEV